MSVTNVDCQRAASYLGVSVKTIRRWAQDGKLHGKKVGSRGDWRFTHNELDKMIHTGANRFDTIAGYLRKNAAAIADQADDKQRALPGFDEKRWKEVRKNRRFHIEIIKLLGSHLDDVENGKPAFDNLSTSIAEISRKRGLSIEETVEGVMFLKQALWSCLETTDLLLKLSTTDIYALTRAISTYNDIITAQIAITYHREYARGQDAQKQSDEKFSKIFHAGPVAYSIIRFSTGKWIEVNEQFVKLTGYSRAEVIGRDSMEINLLADDDAAKGVMQRRAALKKAGRLPKYYLTFRTKNGELKNVRGSSVMTKINGEDHAITMHLDITDHTRAEKALRLREERYRTLFNSIEGGFCVAEILYDDKGKPHDLRYHEVNAKFESVTAMKDPVGKTLRELVPNVPSKWLEAFAKVVETGKPGRTVDYSESRKIWYDINSTRVGGPGSHMLAMLFSDITEKKKVEQEHEEGHRRVINVLESMGDAFIQFDNDWNIILVNKEYVRISKKSRHELIGRNLKDVFENPDGKSKPYKLLTEAIKTRQPVQYVHYYESLNLWTDVRAYPTDEGISVFMRDISLEKAADEKQKQLTKLSEEHDELLRISRAKDEFIGVASHQLRTPATAVKQYVGILLTGMFGTLSKQQQKYLETAYNSNERQLKLINDLLKTAQIDAAAYSLQTSEQSIGQLLGTVIGALQSTFDQREQRVHMKDLSKGLKANVDPVEMDLVFSNLLDNASKYSPHETAIDVVVRSVGKEIEIAITDQGVGISPSDHDKIFDKFTRINNEMAATVSGTGLGLYWVQQIVQMHGGSITVESEINKGSTFKVRLPL
jgi:PAS domain S-box-containing protein/excisionase family DNA binding protein